MQNQVIRDKQTMAQVEEQTQVLKPLLQAEVRILRMTQQELEQDVRNQLEANPALEEYDDDADIGGPDSTESDSGDLNQDTDADEKTEYSREDYDNDRINDYLPDDIPSYYDPDRTHERLIADQSSFYDLLKEQAAGFDLSEKEQRIMDYLIGSLDEDGFLRKSIRVLCDEMEIYENIQASEDEVKRVLSILQSFEPIGIGAKDLQESLIIQLHHLDRNNPLRDKAIQILTNNFDDYKNKRYQRLCPRFRMDRTTMDEIYNLVRHLNPRPGSSAATSDNTAIPVSPDFLIEETDDGFNITLCRGHIPHVKVSSAYSEFISVSSGASPAEQESARRQVSEAKLYVAAIRQRQRTMLDTMNAIVRMQPDYFRDGDRTLLRPMTQKDIADIIHRDPSTVSGVVSNKYADTPFGIIPLASLFTQSFVNQQGEEVSREAVQIKMRNLIKNENPLHPLTDDELAAKLGIARRTVTKYRKQMRIPVARLRR
ncbi:MAG: RNA polymerase factor sigma-54 [Bacteroidaceae bacterium]|nr:RNA polymerase factor sigma-54 [Bacteroidaceae bacterium]